MPQHRSVSCLHRAAQQQNGTTIECAEPFSLVAPHICRQTNDDVEMGGLVCVVALRTHFLDAVLGPRQPLPLQVLLAAARPRRVVHLLRPPPERHQLSSRRGVLLQVLRGRHPRAMESELALALAQRQAQEALGQVQMPHLLLRSPRLPLRKTMYWWTSAACRFYRGMCPRCSFVPGALPKTSLRLGREG